MTRDCYMLYALKVMTYHHNEQKRKEKFLYNDTDSNSITPPSTPSSIPSTPRGSSPKRGSCVCCGWTVW